MSSELQLAPIPNCELSTTGAMIQPSLEYGSWLAIGRELLRVSACTNWWLGDWGNYGVREYGDKHRIAIELSEQIGIGEDRMRYAMAVASGVVTRVTSLSWTHHREVLGLDAKDQAGWLEKAKAGGWSVSKLRQEIRTASAIYHDSEPNPGLFVWAKTADNLVRFIKQMDNELPIEQWPAARKEAAKEHLKELHELYERL